MKVKYQKQKAFTLIELLVVIVIIGILSTLIIVGMSSLTQDARDSKRKDEANTVRKAIWAYSNMGSKGYPVETNWCCLGKTGDCPNLTAALVPNFLAQLPKDPLYNSSNKEYCYMYKSNGNTFDLYTQLEKPGVVSLSPDSIQISKSKDCSRFPGEWIDTGLGFCVMKWEARFDGTTNCNGGACPISTGVGLPYVQSNPVLPSPASVYCKAIGAHLMNNAEWMAIARDIESVPSNYVPGTSVLKRGNSGDTGTGGYNIGHSESGVSNPLAILTLSNGATINHFSGNVSEWIDYAVSGANSEPQSPFVTISNGQAIEIKNVTDFGNDLGYNDVGPKNTSLDSSNGIGRIYYLSTNTAQETIDRGGDAYGFPAPAGIFSLDLFNNPGQGSGFRCAW